MSEKSVQQYKNTLNYLEKAANSKDLKKISKYIDNANVKDGSKINSYNSIIGLKKSNPSLIPGSIDSIAEARDSLGENIIKARQDNNISNDKQQKAVTNITGDDIEEMIKTLENSKGDNNRSLEDYILARLSYPAPLRNDLMSIKVCKNKKQMYKENCVFLPSKKGEPGKLSIVDHKTSTEKNRRHILRDLSPQVTDDIRKLIKFDGREYLFINRSGIPYSTSAFTHKLNSLFRKHLGIPFSSTTLRKIYLTSKYKPLMKQMEADAKNMGNSVGVQRANYIDNK